MGAGVEIYHLSAKLPINRMYIQFSRKLNTDAASQHPSLKDKTFNDRPNREYPAP